MNGNFIRFIMAGIITAAALFGVYHLGQAARARPTVVVQSQPSVNDHRPTIIHVDVDVDQTVDCLDQAVRNTTEVVRLFFAVAKWLLVVISLILFLAFVVTIAVDWYQSRQRRGDSPK